jgi:predicted nucleotide-binding protein
VIRAPRKAVTNKPCFKRRLYIAKMRKPNRSRPSQPATQMTQQEILQGIDRLTRRLQEVDAFDPGSVTEQHNIPHVEALADAVDESLIRTFGADTLDYKRYSDAAFFDNGPFNYAYAVPISDVRASLKRSKERSSALLAQAISTLRERLAESEIWAPRQSPSKQAAVDRKVFIVHGHDEGMREGVARFLEQIGFRAIILHEQPSQGRTIIEKVEAHGDVSFAVILLTPDDEGRQIGGQLKPRARQNVVLELGYFIGRFGRKRVCALTRGNIEIPSDFAGVVYESFEGPQWRHALGRELEAAGYHIDWNDVMRYR